MRLVSCYIAHFGKIENFSYDFSEGFNAILQENGWGKTTFSVFIKSMFYGMEYSPNTKKKLLDRNHYMPWNGSVCGGNIIFATKDKVYRLERTFGKTDKDDTFALYDNITGLNSDDYTDNIGEELFKVDRDSFEKSVYIPQLSLDTGMTDSLNAKMGNLVSAKDDISNFDIALKSIKDAKGDYTRSSKINPGKLQAIKKEIGKCKDEYSRLPSIVESFEAMSCLVEEKQEQLEKLTEKKNQLMEQIQIQSKKEQELGAYRAHKDTLLKEQETLSALDDFFAAGVPDDEEMAMLENTDRDLEVSERTLKALEEEIKRVGAVVTEPFQMGVPEDSDFANWNRMASSLAELRAKAEHSKLSEDAQKQMAELKFFFKKKMPMEDELSDIEQKTREITGLEARVSQSNDRLISLNAEKAANEKIKKGAGISVWHVFGGALLIIFILAGAIFSKYIRQEIGQIVEVVCLFGGLADMILLIVLSRRSYITNINAAMEYEDRIEEAEDELNILKEQLATIKAQCDEFLANFLLTRADSMQENVYEIRRKLDRYNHLLEEDNKRHEEAADTFDELADMQLELYTKIQPYATAYGVNLYEDGDEYNFLNRLKKDADLYAKYLESTEEIGIQKKKISEMTKALDDVLVRYPINPVLDRSDKIGEISQNRGKYNAITERIKEIEAGIKDFEKNYNVGDEIESVDDLQKRQNELDEQIMELNEQILKEKENLSAAGSTIEGLSDIAEQLDRLTEQEREYKKKAELLNMTEDYLQKARESFLSKYMKPLQTGLHKYLGLIDSPNGTSSGYAIEDFELDMDLNIKLSYAGSSKTSDYLSQGYQDLVALCSRLALVDVLYSDEKPILILDDPFTNLDHKKIEEALKLLNKISKDRQIIYFTCHDSRLVN
ncbi:MAG: hypothetical protein K5773_07645 [Pseudobutyrivibrio sp.]|nr:hypothetical protein [Pseudobutyrivibrio sp.]